MDGVVNQTPFFYETTAMTPVVMPPQVVENDKKKIKDVIDELDHKKNQALQVFIIL